MHARAGLHRQAYIHKMLAQIGVYAHPHTSTCVPSCMQACVFEAATHLCVLADVGMHTHMCLYGQARHLYRQTYTLTCEHAHSQACVQACGLTCTQIATCILHVHVGRDAHSCMKRYVLAKCLHGEACTLTHASTHKHACIQAGTCSSAQTPLHTHPGMLTCAHIHWHIPIRLSQGGLRSCTHMHMHTHT